MKLSAGTFKERLILSFALTILLSIIYLHSNEIVGSLAIDLQYDDVGYANDAANRLGVLHRQGIMAFISGFLNDPPHSPFATALALIAFTLGGVNEFAFYSASVLVLLALAVFLLHETKEFDSAIFWLVGISVLSSPIAFRTIRDFRPDIPLGLATAVMAIWFIEALVAKRKNYFFGAGVMFGVALLVKPTFFAHTIGIALALTGLFAANFSLQVLGLRRDPGIKFRELFRFFAPPLVIALPYFAFKGAAMFDYFYKNTRGEYASVWSLPASETVWSVVEKIYGYLLSLAGAHFYFSLVVCGFSALYLLAIGRHRSEATKCGLQLLIAFTSFVVMVIGRHRNEYFLASTAWLIILSAVLIVPRVFSKSPEWMRKCGFVICYIGLGVAVVYNSEAPRIDDSEALRSRGLNSSIVSYVGEDFSSLTGGFDSPQVFVPFAGAVNADVMRWITLRDNKPGVFSSGYMVGDFEVAKERASASDYVIIPNELKSGYSRYLPSTPLIPVLTEWLLLESNFKLVPQYDKEPFYFIFRNSRVGSESVQSVRIQGAVTVLEGFRQEEGPHPQWNLPRVRWMTQQDAKVCLLGDPLSQYEVRLGMRTDKDGLLKVLDDTGKELSSKMLSARDPIVDDSFSFKGGAPKSCMRFFYLTEKKSEASDLLVLFSKIEAVEKTSQR